MRRIVLPILSLFAVACTNEIDEPSLWENPEETAKTADTGKQTLVFEQRSFSIPEHSEAGSSIGFLRTTDGDKNPVTYTLECDTDIEIDENTGELRVGANLDLDYERTDKIQFSVSAFNGTAIAEKTYDLNVQDVDETAFLSAEEKELVDYFQYLSLWKGPNHASKLKHRKWGEKMKLHLGGTISETFRSAVERVIAQYNSVMTSGDFRISLVDDREEANAHLFFGNKSEVEAVWPDMFGIIENGNYDGYAMTPSQNNVLHGTRIWMSNPLEALFKHELGHALGLGHSNRCEDGNSFLCSTIGSANDILPIEEEVIRYLYHADMPAGLTETEIEKLLADLIVSEK